mgnify:CR=1 FL=1
MPHKDDAEFKRSRYGSTRMGLEVITDKYLDLFTLTQIDYFFTDVLKDVARERVRMNRRRWRFYQGKHYEQPIIDGESKFVAPYVKAIVDFGVDFLVGLGEGAPWKTKTPKGNEALGELIEKVWEDNDRDVLAFEMAQTAAITGDDFVQVTYEDKYDLEKPVPPDERKLRLISLDSSYVFPEWSATDKDRMMACLIQYPIFVDAFDPKSQKRIRQQRVYSQYVTTETITEWIDQERIREIPNPFGEVNIVRIKNTPLAGSSYGQSDVDSLIPLNEELDELLENISEIVEYHAAPVTAIYGAKASTLEKSAN